MDDINNPGASSDAHGAMETVLADTSSNTANGECEQVREPKSRFELIIHESLASLYDGRDCIDCYDIVPDRARTDAAIGTIEMREEVFLCLVHIAESIIGGPPHDAEQTIKLRFKQILLMFGNSINIELVKQLIHETLTNGNALTDLEEGATDGCC